jgi:hypothetical protein
MTDTESMDARQKANIRRAERELAKAEQTLADADWRRDYAANEYGLSDDRYRDAQAKSIKAADRVRSIRSRLETRRRLAAAR